jgi:hypothetical protein
MRDCISRQLAPEEGAGVVILQSGEAVNLPIMTAVFIPVIVNY